MDGEDDYPEGVAKAALVVLPAPDATDAQCDAVAAAVGGTVYEARLRLKEPLPRVVRVAPLDEVEATADALRGAQLEAEALDAQVILGEFRPFRVRALQADGPAMRLSGPRGEVRVDLTRPALLVSGRFAPGLAGMPDTLFAHLYAGGWSDPLELVESDTAASELLGPAKGPARRANFRGALELLRQQPGVAFDDRLVQHASRIMECTVGDVTIAPPGVTERGAQVATDLMSRVIHGLWRACLDESAAAAHDGGLAVISTEPAARGSASVIAAAPPQLLGRASRAAGLIMQPGGEASRVERLRLEAAPPTPPPVPRDPTRPLAPNVPGAPPITIVSRALALQVPHACVCCLAPPGRTALDIVAREERSAGERVRSAIGTALGFGWLSFNFGKDEGELATRLRCPACDTCRRHEVGYEVAWIVVLVVTFLGLLVTLGVLGHARLSLLLVAAVVASWGAAFLVAGLTTAAILSRLGPRCPPHRPIRATCRGDEFQVVFGNRRFGERVAELNPDLVVELR